MITKYTEMTPEMLEFYVTRLQSSALMYYADKLSVEQFDYCVRQKPLIALDYCADKLTQEQIDYCIKMQDYEIEKSNAFYEALENSLENQCFKDTKVRKPLIVILYMILTLSFLSIFLQAYYN